MPPVKKKPTSPVKGQIDIDEFGVKKIDNKELKANDVPSADADWGLLWHFALTFNGYAFWGSTHRCAEIANTRKHDSLTELRTCLFFEQRRWRHFGETPDKKAAAYIRKIVEQIRRRIVAEDVA
jgi:hypothetical protein